MLQLRTTLISLLAEPDSALQRMAAIFQGKGFQYADDVGRCSNSCRRPPVYGSCLQPSITGVAILDVAVAGELTLVDHVDRAPLLLKSPATAAIVPHDFPATDKPTIAVDDVHAAFAKVVNHFRPARLRQRGGISLAAWMSPTAKVGQNVGRPSGATIGDEVVIGDNVTIHSGVRILAGCVIGWAQRFFLMPCCTKKLASASESSFMPARSWGRMASDTVKSTERIELSAQLGNVVIGNDVEIGACATVDRGTYGATTIGDGSKIDNLVQIGSQLPTREAQSHLRTGGHRWQYHDGRLRGDGWSGRGSRSRSHWTKVLCSAQRQGYRTMWPDGEIMLGQPATPLRRQKLQMAAIAKLPEMRREFRQLQQQLAGIAQRH